MQQPPLETESVMTRREDGRLLTYILHVRQQPMRARACGSGPRSASDRRPVDPPPVIQLRIFIGENREKDITMEYDGSFVLYTSLEVARPIASGHRLTGTPPPVLTGVPVAGCSYLDKPEKAAYFIFPDLSVRHEGWYNLKFCLFEKVRIPKDGINCPPGFPPTSDKELEGMVNRMTVRTTKFQVYSAKKFPGLDSSTHLCKELAEQGCRVRIRRDIRQRRRRVKTDDFEENVEQPTQGSPETINSVVQTPTVDHHRSMSRSSFHGSQYGPTDVSRGTAAMDNQLPALPSILTETGPSVNTPPSQSQPPPRMPPPSNGIGMGMPPPNMDRRASIPSFLPPPAATQGYQSYGANTLPPISSIDIPGQSREPYRPGVSSQEGNPYYDMEQRRWNPKVVQPMAGTKRSASPREKSERLVQGARPGDVRPSSMSLSPISSQIEAAESDDEGDDMPFVYTYSRADGSRNIKNMDHLPSHR